MNEPSQTNEPERRLRRLSQMRSFILEARRNAVSAYRQGKFPHNLQPDIRSDLAYWQSLKDEEASPSAGRGWPTL